MEVNPDEVSGVATQARYIRMVIVLTDNATNTSTAVANSSKAIAIGNILTMLSNCA
jgi:hypothetical protein